jgi:hypothetical protein
MLSAVQKSAGNICCGQIFNIQRSFHCINAAILRQADYVTVGLSDILAISEHGRKDLGAGSNISTVTLHAVGGYEKVTLCLGV